MARKRAHSPAPTPPRPTWLRVADKALRVVAIALFAAAVFWFGHRFSPLGQPAEATIYYSVGDAFAGVPTVWELQVDPDKVESAELNGNRIFYTVSEDWRSVSEVLDYYEQLYSGPKMQYGGARPVLPDVEGMDWQGLLDEMNHSAVSRALRFETSEWGLYGTVVLPEYDDPDFFEEMGRRLEAYHASGHISDLGEAKFVYALRARGAHSTTVLTAWPEREFDVRALMSDGRDDAQGSDPPDLPRLAGDLRLSSFVQERPEMTVHMAQYQSRQSDDAVLDFYLSRLPSYDWAEDPGVRESAELLGRAPTALFTRGRQQLHVTVHDDVETDTAVATVLMTAPPGSHGR